MPTLYIVATPIGNLEDITRRTLRILGEVDAIFCEDTRVTQKLLAHYEIKKPLLSLRERAQDKAIARVIKLLNEGKNIAYVTDAGTPGISDPGGKLVSQITLSLGHSVTIVPIPGPSALIAAASIAGISMDRFLFMGFPPHKKGRKKYFEEVATSIHPVIFYESPHRIIRSLKELQQHTSPPLRGGGESSSGGFAGSCRYNICCVKLPGNWGGVRNIIVCRELTKKFETIYRGTIDEVLPEIEKNPRGEFVVIVEK